MGIFDVVNPMRFKEHFESILSHLTRESKNIFIMGDFNIILPTCESHPESNDFAFILNCFFLLAPYILQPTCVTERSATLTDTLWVKRKKKPGPKQKKDTIDEAKKIRLAASDKGSWYNQSELLLTSSNACETGKEIGASSSKIYTSRRVQSEEEDWITDSTQSESEMEFDNVDRPNTLAVVDRLKINNELLHFASCSYCGQR